MGNGSSNIPDRPNVTVLTNTMNILTLKTGYILEVPIRMISIDPNISVREINNECMRTDGLSSLGVRCVDIELQRKLAKFMITAYYNERHRIEGLETGILYSTSNEEEEIMEYHKKVARRVWDDLGEYVDLLNKLVMQKTKKLKISGSHIIEIIADYWSSGIDGRYLYELGDYAIRFPYLKDLILERFINESNDKQITFKAIAVKYVSTEKIKKGVHFVFFIDIEKT